MEEYAENIIARAKNIKLLLLDVDGVMTDGRIMYGNFGDELKSFDVSDGLGIVLLKRSGIKCGIITAQGSAIVKRRAKTLNMDCVLSGYHYKIKALGKIKRKFRVKEEEICFVGDDLIDIPILKRVGLGIAVANAQESVKKAVHFTTKNQGGRGAVREVCELLLKAQAKWEYVSRSYFV